MAGRLLAHENGLEGRVRVLGVVEVDVDGLVEFCLRFPDDKSDQNDGHDHLEGQGYDGDSGALRSVQNLQNEFKNQTRKTTTRP